MTAVLPDRATAVADPATVADWLNTLHRNSRGHVWIGSDLDRFRGHTFATTDPHWTTAALRHIGHLDRAGAAGIYARTTTLRQPPVDQHGRRQGRGGDDDSLTLPGLAADLDIAGPGHKTTKRLPADPDAAMEIVYDSGLPDPSIWVHSGGGLYAWWLLDQSHHITPATLGRTKRLAARWQDPLAAASQRLGYAYGRLGDLARILRIPGTVNRKPAMPAPAPCRILADTGRRYSLDNLRGCLHDALAALPAAPTHLVPTSPPPRPGRGGGTPGDDYEQRVDWADILMPHGWALSHHHGRTRYWVRPGKEPREGHSASTGRAADRDRIWVFSDATNLPHMTPLTKFAAYSHLEHGGDYTAAARELRRQGYGTTTEGPGT